MTPWASPARAGGGRRSPGATSRGWALAPDPCGAGSTGCRPVTVRSGPPLGPRGTCDNRSAPCTTVAGSLRAPPAERRIECHGGQWADRYAGSRRGTAPAGGRPGTVKLGGKGPVDPRRARQQRRSAARRVLHTRESVIQHGHARRGRPPRSAADNLPALQVDPRPYPRSSATTPAVSNAAARYKLLPLSAHAWPPIPAARRAQALSPTPIANTMNTATRRSVPEAATPSVRAGAARRGAGGTPPRH